MTGRSEHKKKVSFLLPTWYTSTIIAIDAKGEEIIISVHPYQLSGIPSEPLRWRY